MATVPRSETTKTLNSRVQLPNTRAALQCIKEEYVESKNSGNMMLHRTLQVIEHAPVSIDNTPYDVSGVELEQYIVLKKSNGQGGFLPNDHPDAKKALGRAYDDRDACGLEGDIDPENPTLDAQGKVFDAMIGSEEQKRFHPPTAEQIAKGQKIGDAMLDDNGKQVVSFRPKLLYILGPSKTEAKPF